MTTQDTTTPTTTLGHVRAALLILEHTTDAGLPDPFTMGANEYSIDFGFLTLDDLVAWSTWLDEPISDRIGATGRTHYDLAGVALEQPIRCWHVTRTATVAKTPLTVVPS